MIKVLITSFGSNTAIGVAKSLANNPDIYIVGLDSNPIHLCSGYKFANEIFQGPLATSITYHQFIKDLIRDKGINCVIPIHDLEIEALSEIASSINRISFLASNRKEIVKACNDKRRINRIVMSYGIPVPKMFDSYDSSIFPVIVKPNKGVSSRDIKVLYSSTNESKLDEGTLIQEFIQGQEYTVDCYSSYQNFGFKYSVRKRIETKEGMSTKGIILDIPQLGEYCKIIHENLSYKGVSNIQFIEKSGQFYFIEINPRFAGGGILTYKSGFNFPEWLVLESQGLLTSTEFQNSQVQLGNKMVRYLDETFFDSSNNHIRS